MGKKIIEIKWPKLVKRRIEMAEILEMEWPEIGSWGRRGQSNGNRDMEIEKMVEIAREYEVQL